MAKDYYKILGVEKNATAEDLKKAFRKLAHQHHPDKSGGDEAKFKEINEAYQVLGNQEKRSQYDQYGATFDQQGGFGGGMNWEDFMRQARGGQGGGFGGINFDFGGVDLGDMFGDVFGFGGGRRTGGKKRGQDIEIDLELDLTEAAFGAKKTFNLYKTTACAHCGGSGAEPGTKINTCKTCGGAGQVSRVQRTFIGNIQTRSTCPDCSGQGKIPEQLCRECRGEGVVKKQTEVSIDVPAGVEDGTALRLSGGGESAVRNGVSGDLYVHVRVRRDKRFERRGPDLFSKVSLTFSQSALGAKVEIPTLEGSAELKIPAGTQPGTQFRLREKGVPRMNRRDRGDLYVEAVLKVPEKLSRKQKQLLEEFDDV